MTMQTDVKSPFDYFTAGNLAFKETYEKSIASMTKMNSLSKKNLEAFVASMTAAAKGAETVGAHTVAFSKKSFEGQVAAAKALTAAKSLQEAVELQTGFAKAAFESYVAQMTKLSELMVATSKETFQPIQGRVQAWVDVVQSARAA